MTKFIRKRQYANYKLRNLPYVIYNETRLIKLKSYTVGENFNKQDAIAIGIHNEIYNNLKSFEEMCIYMHLWTSNRLTYSPCYGIEYDLNLSEHGDNIHHYIPELNKYGYYTSSSQPSKNLWKNTPDSWMQRAGISGFMKQKVADRICNMLKDDSRIIICTKDKIYNNAREKLPIDGTNCINVTKAGNEPCTFFGVFTMPGQKKSALKKYCLESQHKRRVVPIDIIDKEFGNNDEYVFKKVLKALQKVNKPLNIDDYDNLKRFK